MDSIAIWILRLDFFKNVIRRILGADGFGNCFTNLRTCKKPKKPIFFSNLLYQILLLYLKKYIMYCIGLMNTLKRIFTIQKGKVKDSSSNRK